MSGQNPVAMWTCVMAAGAVSITGDDVFGALLLASRTATDHVAIEAIE